MSECYDAKLCEKTHEQIDETLKLHNNRLNSHSDEIHDLQQVSASRTAEVSNMCKSIDNLNKRIDKIIEQNRNLLITLLMAFVGFFIFVIEKGIFK
jgi:TolA-binding protein